MTKSNLGRKEFIYGGMFAIGALSSHMTLAWHVETLTQYCGNQRAHEHIIYDSSIALQLSELGEGMNGDFGLSEGQSYVGCFFVSSA